MNKNIALILLRKKIGLRQKNMADKLGISPSHYSNIERGSRNLTENHIKIIEKIISLKKHKNLSVEEHFLRLRKNYV